MPYIIKNTSGRILRKGNSLTEGQILMFGTMEEASRYIDRNCNSSPYLFIEKFI